MSVWTIARFTFREARRRRLLWLGIGLGLIFVALFGLVFYLLYSQARRSILLTMVSDNDAQFALDLVANIFLKMGLFVVNFLVVLVSILTTVGAISSEISSHTIQTVVTKPLRRWEIILGKWLGHTIMVAAYILLLIGGMILVVYLISGYLPSKVIEGLGLYVLEGVVLMTVSILGGTRLSTLPNGVLVFMVYGLAFLGGWIEAVISLPFIRVFLNSDTAINVGVLAGRLLPSEILWRRAFYVMTPTVPTTANFQDFPTLFLSFGRPPAPSIVLYALAYTGLMLLLAVWSFRRRDL